MRFIYKWKRSLLTSVLCMCTIFSSTAFAAEEAALEAESSYYQGIDSNDWENWPSGPQVYAESAIVMEASTGTILYSKDIDTQRYPASITKIMTVLLALENLDMNEEVTFSHNAVYSIDYDSSHIARDEGEILTVEECLYAIMLESANECSNAIAEKISGTTEAFAELMNTRAAELGCTNTNFVNPHGLPDDNHYTTARDMALITREAIKHEEFRRISSTPRYTLRATNKKSEELLMNNHHYMISNYKTSKFLDDTVFAGKTGYTSVALNTLVTCGTRNGMDLIVVTMKTQGSGQRGVPVYPDTANLLNYAGENFHKVNISENETNFTIGQNELFDTGSSIFGSTAPMIEMDTDGYIILPVNTDFSAASPKLEFLEQTEGSNAIAALSYTYAGQQVGSTRLLLSDSSLQEFHFQKTDSQDEAASPEASVSEEVPAANEQTNLIKVNLRIVGIILCVLLLLLAGFLLFRKFVTDYAVDLSFIRRWKSGKSDWNSFSNQKRRRYQSRKRRKRRRH
ncbi:MAG: D-alanyl-D-alanine carboxypeptidase [Clostridiales bacterium]|nr:D-alanyl-D-alanine carboxypeptidase [Clostridiales bacterium]